MTSLGAGIDWDRPVVRDPEPSIEERVAHAVAAQLPVMAATLARSISDTLAENLPRNEQPPPLDLAEVVQAVQGLKGPATAEDIAEAITARLSPPAEPQSLEPLVAEIRALTEKMDWRMQGVAFGGGSGGGGGTLALSSDPDRQLGVVSVTGNVATTPALPRQKKRIEFIPSSAAPTTIYTGYAPNGTADSAASWTIQRIVFTGTTAIDETWTAVGSAVWANRATETYT